jgi:hypothetical protein
VLGSNGFILHLEIPPTEAHPKPTAALETASNRVKTASNLIKKIARKHLSCVSFMSVEFRHFTQTTCAFYGLALFYFQICQTKSCRFVCNRLRATSTIAQIRVSVSLAIRVLAFVLLVQ